MKEERTFHPVFLTESLAEAKDFAQQLEDSSVPCLVDREYGHGYTELTDHLAVEDAPCFSVSVPEEQVDFARRILEKQELVSMAEPAQFQPQTKPWVKTVLRVVIISWLVLLTWLMISLFE